jgi:hypothetical protein
MRRKVKQVVLLDNGRPHVSEYRIYAISLDNRIMRAPAVERFDTDEEALSLAVRMATPSTGAEVWMGERLVCKVPPQNASLKAWPWLAKHPRLTSRADA